MTLVGSCNGETTKHQTPFLIPVQKHRRRTIHETLEWLKQRSMAIWIENIVLPIRVIRRLLCSQNIPCVFSSLDSNLMVFRCNHCRILVSSYPLTLRWSSDLPLGIIMMSRSTMIPTMIHILIFMFFHHICLRTLFAPRRKPWAD